MARKPLAAFAAVSAVLVAGAGASAAYAGEVNGSSTNPKHYYAQGRSICDFSGLNDNPASTNPMDPGGRVQSYGYSFARNGLKDVVPSPGFACNPNNGFE